VGGVVAAVVHRLFPATIALVHLGNAEKIVIPAKAGIQGVDFTGLFFW
jgi:hypothetical protein